MRNYRDYADNFTFPASAHKYVSAKKPSVYRPAWELKGLQKVFLKAGESKSVTISLDDKVFRYFNGKTNRFEIDGGEYDILIGASVADIRLTGTISVKGTDASAPEDLSKLPDYVSGNIFNVPDAEFETLLGRSIPDGHWTGTLQMNDAICQLYYAKSLKARIVYKIDLLQNLKAAQPVFLKFCEKSSNLPDFATDRRSQAGFATSLIMTGMLNRSIKKGEPDLNITFIYNMPFRAIGKMTGGVCSQEMCEGILTIVNGHGIAFCKGLGKIIAGYFKQWKVMKHAQSVE